MRPDGIRVEVILHYHSNAESVMLAASWGAIRTKSTDEQWEKVVVQ
jgi:hypothetical protein